MGDRDTSLDDINDQTQKMVHKWTFTTFEKNIVSKVKSEVDSVVTTI